MYNAQDSIIRCLESVLKQSYQGAMEIIVVNDGSIDQSPQMVVDFAKKHADYSIQLINQENGGVSKARNTGLRAAKGDFIALLDSDDEWFKNKLEIQIAYLRDTKLNVDFVASNRNDEKTTFPYRIINDEYAVITLKKLLFKIVGQTSTAIFKNEIIQNTGFFDENQKYSEDANYWLRISLNNKMILLSESLAITGGGKPSVGYSGLSSNVEGMERGVQKNLLEMYSNKHINIFEFIFYFNFAKLKYVKRMIMLRNRK